MVYTYHLCPNLKTVYIYNRERVLIDAKGYCPFEGLPSERILYVVKGMRQRYTASIYKHMFSRIVGM